jgi:hypothetical protein
MSMYHGVKHQVRSCLACHHSHCTLCVAWCRSAAGLVGELVDSFAGFQDQGLFTTPAAAGSEAAAAAAAAAAGPETAGAGAVAGVSSSSGSEGGSQQAWEVVFCRKAQLLALDLATQLAGSDSRFDWGDLDQLTADSGGLTWLTVPSRFV